MSFTVLVIDDYQPVRLVIKRALESISGKGCQESTWRILEAGNIQEALEIYRQTPDVNFLVIDFILPDGKGTDLLAKLSPPPHHVFVSGYSDEVLDPKVADNGHFMRKPLQMRELYDKIFEIVQEAL